MENKPNSKSYKNTICPTNLKWHSKLFENLVEEGSPFCSFLAGTQTAGGVTGMLSKSQLHQITYKYREEKSIVRKGSVSLLTVHIWDHHIII